MAQAFGVDLTDLQMHSMHHPPVPPIKGLASPRQEPPNMAQAGGFTPRTAASMQALVAGVQEKITALEVGGWLGAWLGVVRGGWLGAACAGEQASLLACSSCDKRCA